MADTGGHTTRRDKGAGAITKLGNGRYRAFVELSPNPADGSRRRTSATGHTRTEALTTPAPKPAASRRTSPWWTNRPP